MISVVVITHNSESCVDTCIDAIERWLPDAEKLVVDNASDDMSRPIAERRGATVIGLAENLGFGRACNMGAARAERSHILFLNPDVVIQSADLSKLEELRDAVDLGLVVPTPTGEPFAFVERSWIQEVVLLTLRPLRPREFPRRRRATHGHDTLWASGAALLVRRTEFLDAGGFDPRYFLYYEDRDLSRRYRESGWAVHVTPALYAGHAGGRSSDLGDRRPNIIAYSTMGWLQYTVTVYGRRSAVYAWRITQRLHFATERAIGVVSHVVPSKRLRRKHLQMREVRRELDGIRASAGVLAASDEHAYWHEAIALIDGCDARRAI